ncbi:MAG: HAD-IIIA family hydrolase [candidate division KSB1 bacterium]|nr:HAD-IIIA family hydrolase [candidate division KSB1 bacterium]MDZ7275641.1 HAD-IIIA family hydrolase [candidate division KSB1 bacterium]MDZ7284668.1 HAD-IIIA family hydrolase [candidate division KSB1 bacterium]MDZ7297913.1 HAD-IIIA family hydrolase [candidate division KSB1 bacterium]MDZ7307122.1 HAD-IIIA family hydrolase [candidate division KSB1 bacterium]
MGEPTRQAAFVFLDRDGTLIEEKNYLRRLEDIAFLPGSEAAVARLQRAGLRVVVISNQSGVARGYFSAAFVQETHRALQQHLARHGAWIDGFYFCPHAPEANCHCRKPRPGMLEQASRDFACELTGFMVGDRASDIETGRNAGLRTVLVRTGYGEETARRGECQPDFIADDLAAAVDWILPQVA